MTHVEQHRSHRAGWLRASVLGANDGIVSTASLVIGVASAGASQESILLAGVAGVAAGALSMAAGEYVSVSSQADTEQADLAMEAQSLIDHPESELKELKNIYIDRGLQPALAKQVAVELTEHDALGAHARDDIGIGEITTAKPLQAAIYSAISFVLGAFAPLLLVWFFNADYQVTAIAVGSLVYLAALGALAARLGGASIIRGAVRVMFWGALAMFLTALVGYAFDMLV
ncbi:VIT1/CCC1 transporter family protein [Aliidiomarina quisquiliarum]|uniref:VIT1/CCC1 transporter family protein n=1 Tax=Aliidiomarina quisquiliarum TaxID=2938947 RepID=UPI00208EFC54|nr:VIT family protein [Aliidiomarina quisquiliarum]MCO4320547.1 VIT family protein [Aliidiomarina quisquiliarum]